MVDNMTGYVSKRAAARDKLAQEPVAHLCKPDKHGLFDFPTPDKACEDCFPVYTTPPQSPWIGLTDEEVDQFHDWKERTWSTNELVRHIESVLRSKNT
jgi:hypothetical protein